MPDIQKGESEKDYVKKCIPYVIKKEGLNPDQAAGKCYGIYRGRDKMNVKVYRKQNNAKSVGGFESPEPGDLPKAGADLLAKVYAQYRKEGMSKEEAAKRAWGAVRQAGYKNNETKGDYVVYKKKDNQDKQDDNSIEKKIVDFFKENPYPKDTLVHQFAEENGMSPDQLEEKLYEFISCVLTGGKSKGESIKVSPEEHEYGIAIEAEHVDEKSKFAPYIQDKIRSDHHAEYEDYYMRFLAEELIKEGIIDKK